MVNRTARRMAAPTDTPARGGEGITMHAGVLPRSTSPSIHWNGSWSPRLPREVACVDGLAPTQRLLLTTDGTLTPTLSMLVGEPIGVRMLAQHETVLSADDDELTLWAQARVLERRVLLHGADSGAPLLCATSRIVVHRLPRPAREQLVEGGVPIGLVIREHAIETLRVPLSVGVGPACEDARAHLGDGPMCHRRFAINAGGRPLMIVDEQFPAAGFASVR